MTYRGLRGPLLDVKWPSFFNPSGHALGNTARSTDPSIPKLHSLLGLNEKDAG